ncbi:Spk1-like Ser/Thr protein kinase [Penicillium taxi]|uniref:Spk1-like Ser/Thr protein kinase n=1 Tax=Penicillium taxi TaxID=168475 RepID=UPI002545A6E2|nr:Spk1-like Ser/Thr protein kinase [Penicillium taxi]KAJ5885538.1 Spk1-like Ser/Thr protein kinase [Penicillium taxi]
MRLDLGKKLGQGGFGTVYDAVLSMLSLDGSHWRHFAVAAKSATKDPGGMIVGTTLENSVISDYIVLIHETFYVEENHEAFAVMPKASDGDLVEFLENYEVPEKDLNKYFRMILLGVKAMHDKGMMHRDLKPANILMFGALPKIADFDVATYDATSEKYSIGTMGYLAPEVMRLQKYDKGVDIFACGMTWMEMTWELVSQSDWYEDSWPIWKDLVDPDEDNSKDKVWLSREDVKEVLIQRVGKNKYSDAKLDLLSKVLCEPSTRIGIDEFIRGLDAL